MKEQNKNLDIENMNAQMRKGTLEFCILLIIGKGKKMYASDILDELKRIDLIVVEGTLYPLLNRLKREGKLEYIWEESKNGPPRKYYSITAEGIKFKKMLTQSWKSLATSIHSLISSHE